jgi:polysaccharide export outer membrane protein
VERSNTTDYLTADERVGTLTETKEALQIRIARLEAQQDDLPAFEPTIPPNPSENLQEAVRRERDTFESEKKILEGQLKTVREQRPRIQSQIDALNGELEAQTKQVELARGQVEKYEELRSTGLARNVTLVEYKQSQVRYESERWRILGELSRLKFDEGELDVKLSTIVSTYKQKVADALDSARQRSKEIDITLPSALNIRATRLAQIGSAIAANGEFVIQVTRVVNGESKIFDALESTALEPGDVVEIKLNLSKS